MRVAILGASGIIGQHMRLCIPAGVDPIWMRKDECPGYLNLDLSDAGETLRFLNRQMPHVIVNLAGENSPDKVEKNPERFYGVNAELPETLAKWCREKYRRLVHVSSQAVFGGEKPPYFWDSRVSPINEYGFQKAEAEQRVREIGGRVVIARATFILGIRPFPDCGRKNPVEQMLSGEQPYQVQDRWFSVLFAHIAALRLWKLAFENPGGVVHLGIPGKTSRYEIARKLGRKVEAANHSDFPGLAPRPRNTAYASAADAGWQLR